MAALACICCNKFDLSIGNELTPRNYCSFIYGCGAHVFSEQFIVYDSMHYFRFSKWRSTTRMSAQSGHSNSVSFHDLRLRSASHADLVICFASSSLSSGSSSSMMSLQSDSSASSSYFCLSSSSPSSSCALSISNCTEILFQNTL